MRKNYALDVKDIHLSYRELKKISIKQLFKFKKKKDNKSFEALKGISFKIEKGKIIGLIGKNGSGKSTLLKAISGIFSPDSGSINLHKNSVSLLSIGVGFQPKLSGYENIFLSGMLLGFSEDEIKDKIDDIIAFADLGEFIYKPVKTYSSGMHSKLAFSITAILETDILLIDEVLSVGDARFKEKSYNKMKELIKDDKRTVIIVSHSLNSLKELCDEVIWLNDGQIKEIGKPKYIIDKYLEFMKQGV